MSETGEWLDRLTERLATAQQQLHDHERPARHARMRAEVLARWSDSAGEPSRPRWWAWSLASGMLLAAALVAWVMAGPAPWALRIDEPLRGEQAQVFIRAGDDQPVVVSFADGSVLTLQSRARVRVDAPDDAGTALVIESGTIELAVQPAGHDTWTITAGPYRLDARGATLTVGWLPDDGSFELVTHAGEAWVEGPRLEGGRSVHGGEHVLLLGDGGERAPRPDETQVANEVVVTEERPPGEGGDQAPPRPTRSHRRSRGHRSIVAPSPALAVEPTQASDATWRTFARRGSHAEAIAAAQTAGFSHLCASLDAEELLELADVARYAGRPSLAREALQALRRRFPGTDAAAAAAFDLGRLAPDGAAHCEIATHWLRIHLDEQPDGPLSEVARRRLDECTKRSATEEPSP